MDSAVITFRDITTNFKFVFCAILPKNRINRHLREIVFVRNCFAYIQSFLNSCGIMLGIPKSANDSANMDIRLDNVQPYSF